MALLTLISKLKEIEQRAAELYLLVCQEVSHRDPRLGQLFQALSEEERVHEKQVEMAINIFREAHDTFSEQPEALDQIGKVLGKITEKEREFKANHEAMSPAAILQMAIEVEENMEERHQTFYLNVHDDQIKALLQSLRNADHAHSQKLKQYPLLPVINLCQDASD
jgi:rubrerythrin